MILRFMSSIFENFFRNDGALVLQPHVVLLRVSLNFSKQAQTTQKMNM